MVESISQGLIEIGLKSKDKIGIFSKNRLEWLTVQSASFLQSNIIISFYETLGVDSLAFVCRHGEIELAFCSKDTLHKTAEISKTVDILKTIICFDDIEDGGEHQSILDSLKDSGIRFFTYSQLMQMGRDVKEKTPHTPPQADTLATIMYTSGTTGDPKGVMLTHKNLTSVISAVNNFVKVYDNDCHYSYLPYAHVLERIIVMCAFHYGASVGIFSGDTSMVLTEVKQLKPTIFIGVPRIFERIRAGVLKEIDKKSAVVKGLFHTCYSLKSWAILHGYRLPLLETLFNKLVFDKVRMQLGGRVRCILSGGAALSRETEAFLATCFSCSVIQGYGLTETCGGTAVKLLDDDRIGSIGPPFVSVEIKLVDVPELNYHSHGKIEQGEVCLRGPSVTVGYYKDPEKTRSEFDADGWFYTGDIGQWNEDGSLSIIDRKKNIFKLSQGEYVAVEKIENILSKSKYVAQICVYGDGKKSFLVAIVHPHPEDIEEFGKSKKSDRSKKEICQDPQFVKMILDDLVKTGRSAKLFGFEIPKAIHLIDEPFSDQNGLMTPSFKLKRPQIKDHFSQEIANLYSSTQEQN
ncbi:fatty acyl-CoA synthetase [Tieghemostelium lacteum]|uniref:Fatty acyl-CoA synthetase n=1 Tax=Tieghemostelium lacteum TaxID=361077 RepID=A0A151ZI08_TIELA|nr:fatty acyl-CoA synthetase [Tieghemostelium lacteum]|eukprot:KYQ93603.1 fatty acyl-CoA synthetase [Tieghemostelium lacteum]